MYKLFLLTGLLVIAIDCSAQLSKTQVEELVTNGTTRNWQFLIYKKSLGAACTGEGQLFTFFTDGKMQRKRCVNGKIEFKEARWKVTAVGNEANGEWQLMLSEPIEIKDGNYLQEMRLDLPQGKTHSRDKKMIWRVVANCKACPEQTIVLTSIN